VFVASFISFCGVKNLEDLVEHTKLKGGLFNKVFESKTETNRGRSFDGRTSVFGRIQADIFLVFFSSFFLFFCVFFVFFIKSRFPGKLFYTHFISVSST